VLGDLPALNSHDVYNANVLAKHVVNVQPDQVTLRRSAHDLQCASRALKPGGNDLAKCFTTVGSSGVWPT